MTVHPAVAAHQRARRRRRADFALRLIANVLAVLFGGWLMMFAVGVVHHEWIGQCPTIGWMPAVALAAFLRGALAPIPSFKSDATN